MNRNFCIVTDSCCDFNAQEYAQLDVSVLPLSLTFRGEVLADRNDDTLKDFYDGLRQGESAQTSAVNPEQWRAAIQQKLEQGEDVLVMAFSSGLSTTYQSAVIAADELAESYPQRSILVLDTLSASMGQGLMVWHACRMRDEGKTLQETYNWCKENLQNFCQWFTVDDLNYLKRGGRISGATALVGTMLNIKPVLHVDAEGHLVNVSKSRGRKAAIQALAQQAETLGKGYPNDVMFITHGDCREDAAYLANLLKERCGVKEVRMNYVGTVIGSHAGPGTLALFFMGSHR